MPKKIGDRIKWIDNDNKEHRGKVVDTNGNLAQIQVDVIADNAELVAVPMDRLEYNRDAF